MTLRHEKRGREDLDETIDRVAGALTLAAADPTLADRIRVRIGESRSHGSPWPRVAFGAAAVAVVAAAIFALMLSDGREKPSPSSTLVSARAGEASASSSSGGALTTPAESGGGVALAPPTGGFATPDNARTAVRLRRPSTLPAAIRSTDVPQIDALSSPAPLAIDELPAEPLTIVPVAVAPLDLANLAVGDGDDRDPKE